MVVFMLVVVLQQHYHASINDTQLSALLPNEEVDGSVYVGSRCIN